MQPAQNILNAIGDTLPTSWTAAGSFNGWNNTDPNTLMEHVGYGIYRKALTIANPGTYEAKIVPTGEWDPAVHQLRVARSEAMVFLHHHQI